MTICRPLAAKPLAMVVLLLGFGAVGCAPSEDLGKVSGVVTIDGQPYPGGKVIFNPIAPAGSSYSGKSAVGRLSDEGRYELSTAAPGDGAQVGEHTVTLFRAGDDSSTRPDLARLGFKRFNIQSGKVTVASGTNEFDFEITSDELRKHGSRL